jgi:SAM-dependent methyltransferase
MGEEGRAISAEETTMFDAVDAYHRHVGRYGDALSREHVQAAGVAPGQRALDVGCGPGVLTSHLAGILGPRNVSAVDPSEPFVNACRARVPGADVRQATAEALPDFGVAFDVVLSQLVVNFMTDPGAGVQKMRDAARPGGTVASCVWDYAEGMTMLRAFWDAALELDPDAPDEGQLMQWCSRAELSELWESHGLHDVEAGELAVGADYKSFDDYWEPFLRGVAPSGAYCAGLGPEGQTALRNACFQRLGSPAGPFSLRARAWFVRGCV